jgi:hypothetical protein
MQVPDIAQLPGASLPLLDGDELVVIRGGVPVKVKFSAVKATSADQVTAHNADAAAHGATAAGLALLTAADLDAQKTILGIGA